MNCWELINLNISIHLSEQRDCDFTLPERTWFVAVKHAKIRFEHKGTLPWLSGMLTMHWTNHERTIKRSEISICLEISISNKEGKFVKCDEFNIMICTNMIHEHLKAPIIYNPTEFLEARHYGQLMWKWNCREYRDFARYGGDTFYRLVNRCFV